MKTPLWYFKRYLSRKANDAAWDYKFSLSMLGWTPDSDRLYDKAMKWKDRAERHGV